MFIHTTGCMFLFYKKKNLLLLFVQLRKSPGKSWNFVKSPKKVLELWCKKSWKVPKSPGIWITFFGENHDVAWAKSVQRRYVWWYLILMQNLKENWLVLSKMTWGIYQIFTRARLKVSKLGLSLGPFIQSKIYELKTYRGVTHYGKEE